jgi:hypothetical protein
VLLAFLEPAQPARFGIPIKQPPILRIRRTTMVRRLAVAVRHPSSCPPPLPDGGGARPLGGLVHRAGAASGHLPPWGIGRRGARPTSYLSRRNPSIAVITRHRLSWRDGWPAAGENPTDSKPGV